MSKSRKPIARITLVTTAEDELAVKARGGDHGYIDVYSRQELGDKLGAIISQFMPWIDPAKCAPSPAAAKARTRVQQTVSTTLRWTFLDGSDLPGDLTLNLRHRHDRFGTECADIGRLTKALGFKK